MTNTTNSKKIVLVLALAIVFAMFGTMASQAHAGYGYYGSSYYDYGNTFGNTYSYYQRPAPQPIYVQQPVYVQPTYVQQPVYVQPTYYQAPTVYYSPLSVSCSVNTTYVNGNGSVTWTAYASGGNGSYSYSWSGTDGLNGSGQSIYFTYYNSGQKYAYVTVYSNGQSQTQSCSNTVNVSTGYAIAPTYYVSQPVVYQNTYQPNYVVASNKLDIGCFADPTNASINQPATWSAEVTGGMAPYTYSWTGSDGLSGSGSSVTKYYSTNGSKSAIVTVTSADGKTGTKACSNALTIGNTTRTYARSNTAQPANQSAAAANTGLTAASLFSLNNVPWGWIAVLVILVLFATVMYLLFNKNKI